VGLVGEVIILLDHHFFSIQFKGTNFPFTRVPRVFYTNFRMNTKGKISDVAPLGNDLSPLA
jgi:hypothetical protein